VIRKTGAFTNKGISMKILIVKYLPLPKGGKFPLFGKEGQGEILRMYMFFSPRYRGRGLG
jgi:hypothetical protein